MPRVRQARPESVRQEGERIPVSSNRAPLLYRNLDTENFSHRWVIDKDDRIAKFLEGGYEFVMPTNKRVGEESVNSQSQDLQGARVSRSAGFGGYRLYLMRIPIDFYNEDQQAKQREVDELEETMRPAKTGKAGVDYGKVTFSRKSTPYGVEVERE